MRIDKFTSSENNRSNWLKRVADYLKLLYEYIKQRLLKVKSILHIDESWCRVRIKYKGMVRNSADILKSMFGFWSTS